VQNDPKKLFLKAIAGVEFIFTFWFVRIPAPRPDRFVGLEKQSRESLPQGCQGLKGAGQQQRDGEFHGRQTMGEVYLARLLEVLIAPGDGFPGMKTEHGGQVFRFIRNLRTSCQLTVILRYFFWFIRLKRAW
jgi:hypothetical protein